MTQGRHPDCSPACGRRCGGQRTAGGRLELGLQRLVARRLGVSAGDRPGGHEAVLGTAYGPTFRTPADFLGALDAVMRGYANWRPSVGVSRSGSYETEQQYRGQSPLPPSDQSSQRHPTSSTP